MDLSIEVLISCMHQKDTSIIQRINIQTDAVVINQCDDNKVEIVKFKNKNGLDCSVKFISTTERGLSKSRNMAVRNATDDICLICDDDEILMDDYESKILEGYSHFPDADVILFALQRNDCDKTYPTVPLKPGYVQILKSSSHQISFKPKSLKDAHINFDEKMGSGTGNGGCEENKFLLDCKKNKLKIYYYPNIIGIVQPSPSQWFHGYTREYIRNLGWSTRRSQGSLMGLLYILYWVVSHHKKYKKDSSFSSTLRNIIMGYFEKR